MQVLENNNLFTEVPAEESAVVSGGYYFNFNLNAYLFGLGAGTVFGNPGLTADEIQYVWEQSLSI
jgi:hypothetical protein